MSRGKVLVVDDDPIVLEVARERLEQAGYAVMLRDQALGTSEFISKQRPDFVLLDINMPGLSGDRLADLLKRQNLTAHVSIILHSSADPAELDRVAARTDVIGAISKTNDDNQFMLQFERITAIARSMRPRSSL